MNESGYSRTHTILLSICPACGHVGLRLEDSETRRCQGERCGWRVVVDKDGKARDWLPVWRGKGR